MIATVCRWALQEHSQGFFCESQFLLEENAEHHTQYLIIIDGLRPTIVAAIIAWITNNSILTQY